MPAVRRQSYRVASLALVLMLAVTVQPALGAPAAPTAADIAAAQQQAASAQSQVKQMQSQLSQGVSAYTQAAGDLQGTQAQIAQNGARLKKLEAQLRQGQATLSQRADYLYRTDGVGFLDVILGSATFDQFASRLFALTRLADQEAQLIGQLKADHAEASQLKAQLAEKEAQQKALLGKVAAERDSVQSALDKQQAYVDSLSGNVQALLQAQQLAASRATPSTAPLPNPPGKTSPPKKHAPGVGLAQATVEGRSGTYTVMADEPLKYAPTSISFSGGCSVFSTVDNGTGTASGHPLRNSELVCAHKTLPFGTRIAITRGSHKVIVVVIDRGPYVSGRVLDVTPRVAGLLGIDGVGSVKCEVVRPQ